MSRHERHNPYQLPLIYPEMSMPTEPLGRYVQRVEHPFCLRSPVDAANYFMLVVYYPFEECVQEELHTLIIDTKNYVCYQVRNFVGSLNSTTVHIGELFRDPIRYRAPGSSSHIIIHQVIPPPAPKTYR